MQPAIIVQIDLFMHSSHKRETLATQHSLNLNVKSKPTLPFTWLISLILAPKIEIDNCENHAISDYVKHLDWQWPSFYSAHDQRVSYTGTCFLIRSMIYLS